LLELLGSRLIVLSVTPEGNSLSAAAEIGEMTDAKAGHEAQWCEELNRFAVSIDFECGAPIAGTRTGFSTRTEHCRG
jgi:hypothetical protein